MSGIKTKKTTATLFLLTVSLLVFGAGCQKKTIQNSSDSNTNHQTTQSNTNTAPCDYSKVVISSTSISDLPNPTSGWVRFTPDVGHFTVAMPKLPDAKTERQFAQEQGNPHLLSFFQYGNKTELHLLYHLEEEERCPAAAITDTSKYFDEYLEKIALPFFTIG